MSEQRDDEARGDDSGEIALDKATTLEAVVLGHPEDERDGGVLGHLREVDHALYRKGLTDRAVIGLVLIVGLLTVLNAWMTVQRSHEIGDLGDTARRIEASEAQNRAYNEQMIATLGRLEGTIAEAERASTLVADYVEQAQAAAAAGQGQGAAVARGLTQIERLVVGIEELLGRPLPPATSETPTSAPG